MSISDAIAVPIPKDAVARSATAKAIRLFFMVSPLFVVVGAPVEERGYCMRAWLYVISSYEIVSLALTT